MVYSLSDLLVKMGAPEVSEKGRVEWHYFDKKRNDIAGFAEIRLEAEGLRLIAELTHIRENYEDDEGRMHDLYVESFFLQANRVAGNRYKVVKIGFDGDAYDGPQKSVIELGLSIFHSRALDINILMVQQMFNKQDILDAVPAEPSGLMKAAIAARRRIEEERAPAQHQCIIIPFPVRQRNLA